MVLYLTNTKSNEKVQLALTPNFLRKLEFLKILWDLKKGKYMIRRKSMRSWEKENIFQLETLMSLYLETCWWGSCSMSVIWSEFIQVIVFENEVADHWGKVVQI